MISRIKSGLEAARNKGKKLGRPEGKVADKVFLEKYKAVIPDIKAGLSIHKLMKLHDLSKGTVIKLRRMVGK